MRRRLGALTLAVCIGVPLVGEPASAAPSANLYVNNTAGANCSEAGTGTQAQPYCTLAAATAVVTAGQTVNVTGTYNEHLTIPKSGTPDSPITFRRTPAGVAKLNAPIGGITIDGQHDVAIFGFLVAGTLNAPGVVLNNSTRITLERVGVDGDGSSTSSPTVPGIQLNAVTDSSVIGARVSGLVTAGITLDAATTRTVLANNYLDGVHGLGIHNAGATGTAITNNTVVYNCSGIRVDGTSSGVSVQNNVADSNISAYTGCDPSTANGINIGVYDDAAHDTIVDYNTVWGGKTGVKSYVWNTPMALAEFRVASGRAAHDTDSHYLDANQDSANSAAPGWQSTDYSGRTREDNPNMPNTGAGPITYADRGDWESRSATVKVTVSAQRTRAGTPIVADASGSTAWFPSTITTYAFDFGDGPTVTQSTPIATHLYRQAGNYEVRVSVWTNNAGSNYAVAGQWTYPPVPRRTVVSPRLPVSRR